MTKYGNKFPMFFTLDVFQHITDTNLKCVINKSHAIILEKKMIPKMNLLIFIISLSFLIQNGVDTKCAPSYTHWERENTENYKTR